MRFMPLPARCLHPKKRLHPLFRRTAQTVLWATAFVTLSIAPYALTSAAAATARTAVEKTIFGRTPEGVEVEQFTLTNRQGATARIITLGATLAELRVPDRAGNLASVVTPVIASEQGFQRGFPQAGSVFGRVANRIAKARFTLDGKDYVLEANNGKNHIHGGRKNFARVVWQAAPLKNPRLPTVELSYRSADGEEGYPGNLVVTAIYTLTDDNILRLDYRATTDKATPLNLTNHAYFNLTPGEDVRGHQVTIHADRYTVVDGELIPTGEIRAVQGTPLDFTRPMPVGARAADLPPSRRYDHNFVINRSAGEPALIRAAKVEAQKSGRVMEVWTTEPGVQLYTSPLGEPTPDERPGFYCFETQHYPDSVNHPHFPSTILRLGETFRSTTEFRFSVKR